METDRYCSSMMHLLMEENLDFETRLLATRNGTKHKILQMCNNINGCDIYFDNGVYSYLATCHYVIRDFRDENYKKFWLQDVYLIYLTYIFNVVKEYLY